MDPLARFHSLTEELRVEVASVDLREARTSDLLEMYVALVVNASNASLITGLTGGQPFDAQKTREALQPIAEELDWRVPPSATKRDPRRG